jgi:lipopolysaccharide kinase (Kdo/WaaP) family protein
MTTVTLEEELHSNTRRTRITYRGLVDGRAAAIKCYRKPLFGLIHWIRALRRGKKIRRVGGPVPPVVYAGWVSELTCFGYATEFLTGYRSMREVLREAVDRDEQIRLLRALGECVANLHKKGIEQPDCNLTNFLIGTDGHIKMVDEDDVRVHPRMLSEVVAVSNLSNLGARLPPGELPLVLYQAYLDALRDTERGMKLDQKHFESQVVEKKQQLRNKRTARDAAPDREYD